MATEISTKRSRSNQWIAAGLANLPLIVFGMLTGWVSPTAIVLKDGLAGKEFSDEVISWIASIEALTSAAGIVLFTFLTERFGRKPSLMLLSLPHLIAILLKLTVINPYSLVVARFICGIATGGCFVVPPIYTKEICEDKIKKRFGSVIFTFQYIGILLMYIFGACLDYSSILYLCIPLPLLHTFLTVFIPESPEYLVKRGKLWDATKAISCLRDLKMNSPEVKSEVNQLVQLKEESLTETPIITYCGIYRDEVKWNSVIICASLLSIQTFGGSYTTIMYSSTLLRSMGCVHTDAKSISLGALLLVGAACSLVVLKSVKRKIVLLIGCSVLAACYLATSAMLFLHSRQYTFPPQLAVLALSIAMLSYGFGVASLPYVIMTEILAPELKSFIWRDCLLFGACASFLSVKLLNPVSSICGMFLMYLIYGLVNIGGVIFTKFYLPETKSKNQEEIEALLRKS